MKRGQRAVEPEPEYDNFEEEAARRVISANSFAKVQQLAIAMQKADAAADEAEEAWEARKKALAKIRDQELPDAVLDTGTNGLDIPSLGRVEAKPDIYGSLPSAEKKPEERAEALAYLERVAPALVKRTLTAKMPRDLPESIDQEQLDTVVSILKRLLPVEVEGRTASEIEADRNNRLTVSVALEAIVQTLVPDTETDVKLDVHAQTLCGWGRARLEDGVFHPWKKIGLTPITRAKIVTPRAPRRARKDNF